MVTVMEYCPSRHLSPTHLPWTQFQESIVGAASQEADVASISTVQHHPTNTGGPASTIRGTVAHTAQPCPEERRPHGRSVRPVATSRLGCGSVGLTTCLCQSLWTGVVEGAEVAESGLGGTTGPSRWGGVGEGRVLLVARTRTV